MENTIFADTVISCLNKILPPVKRSDINIRSGKEKPDIIGIIDGVFFDRAAVGHREIISALKAGVSFVGGSGMCALRLTSLVHIV